MYSPKIDEALIPVLYHTARAKGIPMTKLVTLLIGRALVSENLSGPAIEAVTQLVASREAQEMAAEQVVSGVNKAPN